MGRELQRANHNQRLAEWGRRVEAYRTSGQTVPQWCGENGIAVSTYYAWQRKVFRAVAGTAGPCFAEVPVSAGTFGDRLAVIRSGGIEIELCPGADKAAIHAIIEALRGC